MAFTEHGSDDQTKEDAGQKKLPLNWAFSPSRVALHFFVDGSNRRAQGQLRSFHIPRYTSL